jgi:hypothetical protein
MKARHSERHPSDHEALTETVEKCSGGSAAKSFAYHPHV